MEKKKSYKRVKKTFPCANPLFERWLTEWRDEASTKGWKIQHVYSKALKSLKKYPVPLKSGKEARMLEFFGDKICKMLDEKLVKYYAEHGNEESERGTNDHGNADRMVNAVDDNIINRSPPSSPMPKKRRVPTSREYVPVLRSGAYALLMTLYNNHCQNGPRAFMRKQHLMDAAQPLSDKSFKIPDAGSFYTAWNSMNTLIRKSLVVKEGNPARYLLTEMAMELAERLSTADVQPAVTNSSQENTQSQRSSSQESFPTTSTMSQESTYNSQSSVYSAASTTAALCCPSDRFEYCYVSEANIEVREKDRACVNIDDSMIGFLIKCKKDNLLKSGKCFQMDSSRPMCGDYVYAYLHNNHADDISPGDPSVFRTSVLMTPLLPVCSNSSVPAKSSTTNVLPLRNAVSRVTSASETVLITERSDHSAPSLHSRTVFNPAQFTLNPGNFDVVLCVDNCETISGNVNSRKLAVQNDLRKNGVNFDVRKLNVGDFVWIARERVTQIPGQLRLPVARELVLDYVVERKRMDDLAGSLKDGRFHEQKFRMKNCGLKNPIYLVEMSPNSHLSIPEASLLQAVVNTQVIDNFMVKRTANLAGTVMYLTILTRYLQSIYNNRTLQSCSKDDLPTRLEANEVCQLMTFEEFNSLSVKNKEMTIKDLFVKQMLQLHGLSVDKAAAIIEKYPTPSSLVAAYNRCSTQTEKEKLLADIKFGKSLRKLGPAISKSLAQLYCNSDLR